MKQSTHRRLCTEGSRQIGTHQCSCHGFVCMQADSSASAASMAVVKPRQQPGLYLSHAVCAQQAVCGQGALTSSMSSWPMVAPMPAPEILRNSGAL